MRKALLVTGTAVGLGAVAAVGGYFGLQRYLDWLIAGAKRPLFGVTDRGGSPARPVRAEERTGLTSPRDHA
jgi:hypothetical protein